MTTRRGMVWLGSILFGTVGTIVVVFVLFRTSFDRFSISNTTLLFLSLGSIAFIWLDWILSTKYLRG